MYRGMGALNNRDCRQNASCTTVLDAWCYSGGYFTDGCIAWRAGLDEPPMPIPPGAPIINATGRTDQTVDDIIGASSDQAQLQAWFDEMARKLPEEPPEQPKTDFIPIALIIGAVALFSTLKN